MIVIDIRFHTGKFHATPWGCHVNEGIPEWPPSPWRVLRALIASWKYYEPHLTEDEVGRALMQIASPPQFYLPTASVGHSRHYMPWFKKGPGDTTLIFDTFIAINPQEKVRLVWLDSNPEPQELKTLEMLCSHVSYLGRSESWCKISLAEDSPVPNCYPIGNNETREPIKPVRVLSPRALNPTQLIHSLMVETSTLRSVKKTLDPPGSQWVTYGRPYSILQHTPAVHIPAVVKTSEKFYAVRFALDRKPLPMIQETITVAEQARLAVMACYGKLNNGANSTVLSGKKDGRPLRWNHQHAYYLPTDEDRDGYLDHLTVYIPGGIEDSEKLALASLRDIPWGEYWDRSKDENKKLKVVLLGFLTKDGFYDFPEMFGPSKYWLTCTPYVLTRYPKIRNNGSPKLNAKGKQVDGPQDQVMKEWERLRGNDASLPELLHVGLVDRYYLRQNKTIRWLEFKTRRRRGKGTTSGFIYGMSLEFAEPVLGPIAMGYACHFGLGHFIPCANL